MAYEIRITNAGSKTETDLKLVATLPEKMVLKSAKGPVRYHEDGKAIIFEPIDRLAPKADAVFIVEAKAMEPGSVRFKIQLTSASNQEPLVKMETTRIYSDGPDTAAPKAPVPGPAPVVPPTIPTPSAVSAAYSRSVARAAVALVTPARKNASRDGEGSSLTRRVSGKGLLTRRVSEGPQCRGSWCFTSFRQAPLPTSAQSAHHFHTAPVRVPGSPGHKARRRGTTARSATRS